MNEKGIMPNPHSNMSCQRMPADALVSLQKKNVFSNPINNFNQHEWFVPETDQNFSARYKCPVIK